MSTQEHVDVAARIRETLKDLGLYMQCQFVPWSQSRNKAEKNPSLNWVVRVMRGAKVVAEIEYSAGMGNTPSYGSGYRLNANAMEQIKAECETGMPHAKTFNNKPLRTSTKAIMPKIEDVFHSLASDTDVLDSSSFEEWAGDLGYDPDSRKAEKIYKACLDIALKLRNAIGEDGLTRLREACQDY